MTGARGQVGRALAPLMPGARLAGRDELDVCDAGAVDAAVAEADVIVHLAAMTDVDRCERDPDAAMRVNGEATRTLAEAAARAGARVVYTSTDYVFDGLAAAPYQESHPTAPVNAYGRSKLEGERHVLAEETNLVVRTSWVYGDGRNFIRTILAAARAGRPLRVVGDQRGRPTAAADLAEVLAAVALRPDVNGVLHVSGDGPVVSWADVAEHALAAAGIDVPVQHITSAEWEASTSGPVAPRPANGALALEQARALGLPLRDWREAVAIYARTDEP